MSKCGSMGREMKGHYRGHLGISIEGTSWVGAQALYLLIVV